MLKMHHVSSSLYTYTEIKDVYLASSSDLCMHND
jgi:hypothetical protein